MEGRGGIRYSTIVCPPSSQARSHMRDGSGGVQVRAFIFYCSVREVAAGLEQKLDALLRTCVDIMRSDRLVRALEVLLVIGNTLNAYSDTATRQGEGFTIDSLLKVSRLWNRSGTGRDRHLKLPLPSSFLFLPARLCMQIMLTRSTAGSLTLLDYFVRSEAERGEGDILSLIDDLPSLQLATTLPDVGLLIKDVNLWLRDYDKVSEWVGQRVGEAGRRIDR